MAMAMVVREGGAWVDSTLRPRRTAGQGEHKLSQVFKIFRTVKTVDFGSNAGKFKLYLDLEGAKMAEKPPRIETAEDLLEAHDRQNAVIKELGDLVRAMDLRIRSQQALIDIHHEIFVKAGLAKPRPAEDPLVH